MGKYDQIFCISGSKGKFWHGYEARRYLPPLELPNNEEEEKLPEKPTETRGKLLQLKGEITYLMNKLNTHIDTSKRKKKGVYKEYT